MFITQLAQGAVGVIPQQSVTDWLNSQITDATNLLYVVGGFLVALAVVKIIASQGLNFVSICMAVAVGGFGIWAMTHMDVIAGMFNDQANQSAPASPNAAGSVHAHPFPTTAAADTAPQPGQSFTLVASTS